MFGYKFVKEEALKLLQNEKNTSLEDKAEIVKLKQRVRDLEDNFEKENGVTVRVEKTVVIAKFSKVELAVMLAGIDCLIKNPKTKTDDIRYYLNLFEKITIYMKDMEEDKE